MKQENRNFVLAIAFSFLILVLYPVYLKWISPPKANVPGVVDTNPAVSQSSHIESSTQPTESSVSTPGLQDEKTYPFSNQHFNVEFTDRGAAIVRLVLTQWGKKSKGSEAILIDRKDSGEASFLTTIPAQGTDFDHQAFRLERLDNSAGEIVFSAEEAGKWRMTKAYKFDSDKPVFQLHTTVENLSATQQIAPLQLSSAFVVGSDVMDRRLSESFVSLPDKIASARFDKVAKKLSVIEGNIAWQALTRHFFVLVIRPDAPASISNTTTRDHAAFKSSLQFAPQTIEAGQKVEQNFLVYAGPNYHKNLKSFGYGFEQILSQGFFGIFKLWLLVALQWTYGVVHNYGWAIVLITLAIKLLFSPLTHMSFESMKKMQALQPKLKALQDRHKDDQAKLSKEMMELYKKHKVNPMTGCLPMLLQIPVFIAFYQVLAQTAEFQGEPFIWWIRDLSEADHAFMLPFTLPFIGNFVNILPLLMIGSMVWQQRLTPQTGPSEQQKMMMFMPIVFGFIFYSLPSGLVLYWFVNNVLSILHQLFVKGKALPHHEE